MAEKNSEKLNFNISPSLKKDIERLASYHGKTLSAFMLDVCNILVKSNAERIKEQAQREKEPINFGVVDVKTKTKTRAKAATPQPVAQSDENVNGGDVNG